jgi:O-6-methylguanine DNA methyltransferase
MVGAVDGLSFKTQWGWMGVSATEKGICAITLPHPTRHAAEGSLVKLNGVPSAMRVWSERNAPNMLRDARAQLHDFISGKRQRLDVPLDVSRGPPFQRRVWRTIQRIPFGRVRSYGWVAAKVGGTRYARAVGLALGANPVPIVVPCHRIVAHDGSLGGFSYGVPVKRRLLKLEGSLALLQQKG